MPSCHRKGGRSHSHTGAIAPAAPPTLLAHEVPRPGWRLLLLLLDHHRCPPASSSSSSAAPSGPATLAPPPPSPRLPPPLPYGWWMTPATAASRWPGRHSPPAFSSSSGPRPPLPSLPTSSSSSYLAYAYFALGHYISEGLKSLPHTHGARASHRHLSGHGRPHRGRTRAQHAPLTGPSSTSPPPSSGCSIRPCTRPRPGSRRPPCEHPSCRNTTSSSARSAKAATARPFCARSGTRPAAS